MIQIGRTRIQVGTGADLHITFDDVPQDAPA
jgi:hypothetical protein